MTKTCCRRADFGEAVGLFNPDWFIRVGCTDASAKLRATIASVLGAPTPEPVTGPAGLRVRLLSAELEASQSREGAHRSKIELLSTQLASLAGAEGEAAVARKLAEEERTQRLSVEQQLRQVLDYRGEQSRAETVVTAAHKPQASRKLVGEIADMAAVFLPRLKFLKDSLDVIANEFSSRRGVYKALDRLNRSERDVPHNWKVLEGLRGWWECHVSTGHDDAGRIYARLDAEDRTFHLLISHKGQQQRDLAWLARR